MSELSRSTTSNDTEEKKDRLARILESRRNAPRPLSFGQEALWFEGQRVEDSSVYNIAVALRILSSLEVAALRRAVELLVDRHDQLRTRFPAAAGIPQTITEPQLANVFQATSHIELDSELVVLANQAAQEPFDIDVGPLIRVRLYSRSDADHLLLLVVHHLVADGWSLWLMLDELQTVYSAEVRGERPNLRSLDATYDQFVAWQRESVDSDSWHGHQEFWIDRFAAGRPLLELPTDRVRPALATFRGAIERFELDQELVQRLRQLGYSEGVSPVSLLMAAFQALLFRLTHQEEFVVGLPSTGRGLTQFAGVVGYFVNPLPIHAHVTGSMSFRDLIGQVHERIKEASAHQDYPLQLIVRDLSLARDPARPSFFEAAFVYNKPQRPGLILGADSLTGVRVYQLGEWDVIPFQLERRASIYDLSLQMMEQDDMLSAEFEYSTDLFDRESVLLMAGYYQRLLRGVFTEPDIGIGRHQILSEEQRNQIVTGWNQTCVGRQSNSAIHQLFEIQAGNTPESTAAVFMGERWSYGQLNRRANQLAHFLKEYGIAPGDIVGVHLPRSSEYLSTILGVLKSGAAFLPLETSLPEDRLVVINLS